MYNTYEHAMHRRIPRAGLDAIDSADAAFATLALAVERPLRHETIVIVLDEARRGTAIVVVSGTAQPDSVVEVIECITHGAQREHIGSIVVGSVRPDEVGADARDIDRWLEMSEIAQDVGVDLLEWFVIGAAVRCPRDDLGEAPRW